MSPVSAIPTQSCEDPPPRRAEVQKQILLDYLTAFGFANQLTQEEKLQFIEVAQAFHLTPFKREIHVAVFGEGDYRRLSIITGYEVYLKQAERTGKLDRWKAWVEGEGMTMNALVEIHRKDWSESFVHEMYWAEAVQKKRDGSISLISKIVGNTESNLPLDNPSFITSFLAAAKSHGSEYLESVISALYCAAVSGSKQGIPGEPFPRDTETLKKANSILETLPRFSPAYRLYDMIKRGAEKDIAQLLKERELFGE